MNKSIWYNQGYFARAMGIDLRACPHPHLTGAWVDWREGWLAHHTDYVTLVHTPAMYTEGSIS